MIKKESALVLFTIVILFIGFTGAITDNELQQNIVESPIVPISHTLELINNFRAEHEIQPLKIKQEACDFATIRAEEASTDWSHDKFFAHVRAEHVDTNYRWSENLADNFTDPVLVVEAWKESISHRAVLLSKMTYGCVIRYEHTWAFEGMEKL